MTVAAITIVAFAISTWRRCSSANCRICDHSWSVRKYREEQNNKSHLLSENLGPASRPFSLRSFRRSSIVSCKQITLARIYALCYNLKKMNAWKKFNIGIYYRDSWKAEPRSASEMRCGFIQDVIVWPLRFVTRGTSSVRYRVLTHSLNSTAAPIHGRSDWLRHSLRKRRKYLAFSSQFYL